MLRIKSNPSWKKASMKSNPHKRSSCQPRKYSPLTSPQEHAYATLLRVSRLGDPAAPSTGHGPNSDSDPPTRRKSPMYCPVALKVHIPF